MKPTIKWIILIFLLLLLPSWAQATIYLNCTAETATLDTDLPNPPFCQVPCGSQDIYLGQAKDDISTPQGSRYYQWHVQTPYDSSIYANLKCTGGTCNSAGCTGTMSEAAPITLVSGTSYYIAYLGRWERIDGVDIWHDVESYYQSGDKGIEFYGSGTRWTVSRGRWDNYGSLPDHKFTMWVGNPSHHVNRDLAGCPVYEPDGGDVYYQNSNGYSNANPLLLDYDRWYSVVLMLTVNDWGYPNGHISFWVNGTLIGDYPNACVKASSTSTGYMLDIDGTIAQPREDAPNHYRQYDGFIVTDNVNDINASSDFNYFADPEEGTPLVPNISGVTISGGGI